MHNLNPNEPSGPIENRWEKHLFDLALIAPQNRKKYNIIVVGTGLAGVINLQQGQRLLQQGLGKLPGMGGSEAVFAINRGSIITPRMELMFEGIARRDFSFNFSFLPKSEQGEQSELVCKENL